MPTYTASGLDFISRAADQTRRLGFRLGSLLVPGDVLALSGDLGAGKTTLVQGIAQGWGSTDNVSSPTFVLVNIYRRPDGSLLHHMDAYRMESALEAEDLDIDEMLFLEQWTFLRFVDLAWVADEQRSMKFTPIGERAEELAREFKKLAFGG